MDVPKLIPRRASNTDNHSALNRIAKRGSSISKVASKENAENTAGSTMHRTRLQVAAKVL